MSWLLLPQIGQNVRWRSCQSKFGNDMVAVSFSRTDCLPCFHRERCTKAKTRQSRFAALALST